jgi:hypothetical protein
MPSVDPLLRLHQHMRSGAIGDRHLISPKLLCHLASQKKKGHRPSRNSTFETEALVYL